MSMLEDIESKVEFAFVIDGVYNYTLFFSVFFSIVALVKFFSFALFRLKFEMFNYLGFSMNTSLSLDYNFFALGILFGLIIAYSKFVKEKDYKLRIRYFIYLILFIFVIVFSGSRRAIVVLFLFITYVGYVKIKTLRFIKYKISVRKFNLILGILIFIIMGFIVLKFTGVIDSFSRGNAKYIALKTFDRFLTLISTSEDVRASSSREILWDKSFEI